MVHRGAALALLPIGATLGFYALPTSLQAQWLAQFTPQLLAYSAMGVWALRTSDVLTHLGLERAKVTTGLTWGLLTGLTLGCLNTVVILSIYPSLGYDIIFLKQTPHGRLPVWLMIPWFICAIAFFVEVNFRGFLLGRLADYEQQWRGTHSGTQLAPLALLATTLTFAFDPFMVNTFRHLHWIALWDGLIWGLIWLRTRNLWITIVAHAVEVIVMYSAVRATIG
ncbi:MAG: CPBP family glutamic-type intramembrane protease [Nitrospira sp.]|nr:CPBP family glutamic-type intramembrane protease [Nitrospira sp.]